MLKNKLIVNSFDKLPSPCYVCEQDLLENNLKLLKKVQDEANVNIILALKGFALWFSFDLCKKYLMGCSSSGLNEAKLAKEEFKKEVHTYSPAFKDEEIDEILELSDYIIFNSFSQWKKYKNKAIKKASCGLRINPQCSLVEVDLYNPCSINSRLGIIKENFEEDELDGIEGFHFHALCEQNVGDLDKVLEKFEQNFSKYFKNLKWLNFGGGHHITKSTYDVEALVKLLKNFKKKYPHLKIYLEPGEAVAWESGYLLCTVLDIVKNGMDIVILDTSAETHMPDVLAMPYKPSIKGASSNINEKEFIYKLAGNTCLAGDIIGDYSFDKKLKIGDKIILEDMIHYTMVKTTTFNGINLPSIAIKLNKTSYKIIKNFGYNDYKFRLS